VSQPDLAQKSVSISVFRNINSMLKNRKQNRK
jgi:hypothetical protein